MNNRIKIIWDQIVFFLNENKLSKCPEVENEISNSYFIKYITVIFYNEAAVKLILSDVVNYVISISLRDSKGPKFYHIEQ
jgi:hypothetical protein